MIIGQGIVARVHCFPQKIAMANQPTVFHITHPKAGSQWVRGVLTQCASSRMVPVSFEGAKTQIPQFLEQPVQPGAIYPPLYIPRPRFEATLLPDLHTLFAKGDDEVPSRVKLSNWYNFRLRGQPYVRFVIIRDLRDTLVSLYFSLKYSHPIELEGHSRRRKMLHEASEEEGLLYLMDTALHNAAKIQRSWISEEVFLLKYEDLLADEYGAFEQIIDHCQIDISRERLHAIVRQNSFEVQTSRQRGEEDVTAHHRKGVVGDWRNHFSERLKAAFKEMHGATLIETGYEADLHW